MAPTTLDYQLLSRDERRGMVTASLKEQEQAYYQHVLTRIANASNANALRQIDDTLDKLRRACDGLRAELATFETPAPPPAAETTPKA